MVGSGTTLGMGLGWTICNCDNCLIAGTLLGGGGTAVWEALKDDSAANSAINRTTDKTKTALERLMTRPARPRPKLKTSKFRDKVGKRRRRTCSGYIL